MSSNLILSAIVLISIYSMGCCQVSDSTLDYNNRETIKFDISTGLFYRLNGNGIKIEEGFKRVIKDRYCGTPQKNGTWIKRYENGQIRSIGEYYCNRRYGKWVYFDSRGDLIKISNYALFGVDAFLQSSDTLIHQPWKELLYGEQVRRDSSGTLVSEYYDIKIGLDSIKIIDPLDYSAKASMGRTYISFKKE